ncbi:hypothetical protein Trydic_g17304, partial [Trypoxylus dichotomus]
PFVLRVSLYLERDNVEIIVTPVNLAEVKLLSCANVVPRSGKLQIASTGTNSPSCAVISHELARTKKVAKE